jgi:hypothetical protein
MSGQTGEPASVLTVDTVSNTCCNRKRIALGLQQPCGSSTYTFAYDGLGRLRTRRDNGVVVNYIYDNMPVIQERDGNNWPQVSCTRGLHLSATFEGAGGIGGLLARSHDFTQGPGHL